MAFSFLECLFSFERYLRFCEESDDVLGGSTEAARHSVESGSGNVGAVFFRLGAGDVHRGGGIMTPVVPLP